MSYEPLYHALQIMVSKRLIFWGVFIFRLVYFLYFGGSFKKTIIPFTLVGYLPLYPTCAHGIIVNCIAQTLQLKVPSSAKT